MIKIDLITGFLGSGKTTFIKKYARYLMNQGFKIGILENDHGAVNVDMMLLQELEGENCGIEMVAGGCGADCHKRRFKTKLIALAMSGYDRVIVEPSGIFDVDEFFDTLHEEPLDRWYQVGSVIAVVDAGLSEDIGEEGDYILAEEIASAGKIVLSKTQEVTAEAIEATKEHLKKALKKVQCSRYIDKSFIEKAWDDYTEADYEKIMKAEYVMSDYVKLRFDDDGYKTVYVMNRVLSIENTIKIIDSLFKDKSYGDIQRIKGFMPVDEGWIEINATRDRISTARIDNGQEIIIIIGKNLEESRIQAVFSELE